MFIISKWERPVQAVIEAGLADNNRVIVTTPVTGSFPNGKKANLSAGGLLSGLFAGGQDVNAKMHANRAKPPESVNSQSILSGFPRGYMGMFVVSVSHNGEALTFTPCSQGAWKPYEINYHGDNHETKLAVTVGKQYIKRMYFIKHSFFIEFVTGETVSFQNKKYAKRAKPAFDRMIQLFGLATP